MTLRYEMTENDQVEYNLYLTNKPHLKRTIPAWLFYFVMSVGILLLIVSGSVVGYFIALAGLHLLLASTPFGQRWLVRRSVTKSPDIKRYLGPREVRLEAGGIRSIGSHGERFLTWDSLTLEETTKSFVFSLSLLDSIVVPRHAFTSPQHQAEFLTTVERFRHGQALAAPEPLKQAWYQSKDQVEK